MTITTPPPHKTVWLFWAIVTLLIITTIALNGISLLPYQLYQRLAQNPLITRADIGAENFWQETLLLPLIAFYAQVSNPLTFHILCFFILLAAYFLFAGLAFRRFGFAPALIFTTILATTPLTTVLFSWIGSPDGLTFLLLIPLLFTNSALLVFPLALLGMTNHLVFLFAAVEILTLRWIARDRLGPSHLAALLTGGMLGFTLSKLFFAINHIQVVSRLEYMLARDFDTWTTMNAANFPLTLLSLFNTLWIPLLFCTFVLFKRDRKFLAAVWVMLLLNYGISFFTLDTTRIFSLLSWGILLQCFFRWYELNESEAVFERRKRFIQAAIPVSLVSFLVPRFYSWEGNIHLAPFFDFLWQTFK